MQHLSRLDNLLVPALFLLGSFIAVMARKSGPLRFSQEVRLLLLFLPFLFFGSIAPTPSWPQYYFAPMVFLSLFSAYLLAELPGTRLARPAGVVVLLVLILSLQSGLSRFTPERISALATPSRWYPIRLHEEAVDIAGRFAEQGASGRVLTLAPAVVVEAGLPVYPEFASGRFAWRASYLMPVEERLRQAMVGPDELDAVLRREVPGAILTGEQPDLEQPLIDAARRLGFQPMALSIERTLWMR